MPESAVRFKHITLSFNGEAPVLDDISFEVEAGETCVILGAAGSGKTVLMKIAAGLVSPDSGRLFLLGREVTGLSEQAWFDVRADIGILFQEGGLFDSMTIEENVSYPLMNQRRERKFTGDARAKAEESLRFVELAHTLDKFPSQLSGGMRRRVGIARATVTTPPLLLYDSPTAGLDPITANTIISLIVKARALHETTALIATHRYQDGHLLANFRYNSGSGPSGGALVRATLDEDTRTKFMVMREGKIAFEGSQRELEASADPYLSKFVLQGLG